MKRVIPNAGTLWNILLLVSVIFFSFFLPMLPDVWQFRLLRITYSLIYFAALFSLDKRSRYVVVLFIITFLTEWITSMFNLQVLHMISKGVNIIFFLVIIVSLIRQIASSRNVTAEVILGSIAGYMLMGFVYSIFITIILRLDPGAYNYQQTIISPYTESVNTSVPLYYVFVTITTTGYGDIVPLKPYTRSLATWIAISGQFYIAIIVALLVGKFAVQRHSANDPDDTLV